MKLSIINDIQLWLVLVWNFVLCWQDTVTYRIVAQDANNYFYIAPESGGIYLRKSIVLSNTINNRYVVGIQQNFISMLESIVCLHACISNVPHKILKFLKTGFKGFIMICFPIDDSSSFRQPPTAQTDQCHSYYQCCEGPTTILLQYTILDLC